jgi:hypothetical protein
LYQTFKPETNDIAGYLKTVCEEQYDLYKGVEELMPYAKGVSAKRISLKRMEKKRKWIICG